MTHPSYTGPTTSAHPNGGPLDRVPGPLRPGKDPDTDLKSPGHGYHRETIAPGIVYERDVAVRLRDGVTIYVDVFRPDDDGHYPVLLGWAPFGKHPHVDWDNDFPGADIPPGNSPWTAFEALDPVTWVPWKYAVVNADPRGIRYSEGEAQFMTRQEGEDEHDLIEWLGTREWSNGRVATIGVSYLAMSAYRAAETQPSHLSAVVLWEALTDFYRDVHFHGGIPALNTAHGWMKMTSWSRTAVEDLEAGIREHPLYDEYWTGRVADLSRFEVPVYVVSSWANHGIHTRGTLEAWDRIASRDKWLDANAHKEWAYFYQPDSIRRQRAFLDRFLHDAQTEVAEWPRVRLEVRESLGHSFHRDEREYPLERTRYTPYHLDAQTLSLSLDTPRDEAEHVYDARAGEAHFTLHFPERTEVTGPAALRIWIAPNGADDADLFVAIRKFDANGQPVRFDYLGAWDMDAVALGWLRLSHRALDEARSSPARPRPLHTREERIYDARPVLAQIPILDSATVFEAGSTLRLDIGGHDLVQGEGMFPQHGETRNFGRHVIYTGPTHSSTLLLPVIPSDPDFQERP